MRTALECVLLLTCVVLFLLLRERGQQVNAAIDLCDRWSAMYADEHLKVIKMQQERISHLTSTK